MAIPGKLEVTIKINELPQSKTVENQWKAFEVDCEGTIVSITVKPRIWNKLEQASKDYPSWVAAISGLIGIKTVHGFILEQPNVQVFERKPKEPKSEGVTTALEETPQPAPAQKPPAPKPGVVMARPTKQ